MGQLRNFDVDGYQDRDEHRSKSLLEQLFEARVELVALAIEKMDRPVQEATVDLLLKDIRDLPEDSVPIREKYRQVKSAENREALLQFTEATTKLLLVDVAPLMQWRDATGESDSYRFDLLVTRIQLELLKKSASFDGLRDEVINQVNALRKNLNQVQARAATIKRVNAPDHPFWKEPTHGGLEEMRVQLRGIMQYRQKDVRLPAEPRIYDIPENLDLVAEEEYQPRALEGMDMIQYRNRVEAVLRRLEAENPTLLKIKRGQSVSEKDLDDLVKLVLVQDSMVDLRLLREFFPDTAGHLDFAIRRIIGMEAQGRRQGLRRFRPSATRHVSRHQIQFLDLTQEPHSEERRHPARGRAPPLRTLHADSVDGVFKDDQQVDFLLNVLDRFKPTQGPQTTRMITGQMKSRIDKLWTEFWTGGITNPLTVIEQISYLMFLRMLDIRESRNEKLAQRVRTCGKSTFTLLYGPDQQTSAGHPAPRPRN